MSQLLECLNGPNCGGKFPMTGKKDVDKWGYQSKAIKNGKRHFYLMKDNQYIYQGLLTDKEIKEFEKLMS